MSSPPDDLAQLYEAAYPRLVAVVSAVSGRPGEAEEAVQDAFVRLLGQWDRVARYDDPEAWLRRVALGFAGNRRRKTRNGLRAVLRLGRPDDVAPPSGDAVDLRRALAGLRHEQREVLVLQHYVGLEVEAIARELGVPVGTVKSRLARARAALAPLLQEVDRG